ncbi:methylated-DNA--[protein]-cysteine S-methyltransferase [Novosphingobium sp. G106]|uniref:bifunctional transcriptional activator/DNA repair enzyme AdaA n=1 Tax=Novosphingobium sp. G106 TaxID=2849500 RepID=UPI001C2D8868|nr:methylated-DNA--[protein]-cysteine S-methyltransferase [Novosphingobium sp. G106]MBV1688012.1 methylated-DNA--[protein]-cysteine S-methyltransferase [Novosphingobium sp. G106]
MYHDVTIKTPTDDEARWRIALAKDRRFDGTFITGVHSTGIYCRPSCPARPPKRENVVFYATAADAEAAGLRACLRCRPDDVSRDEAAVVQAIKMLRDAEETVPLETLAAAAGYSPAHFQRLFKRAVGLSPAAFARALRMERAEDALSAGGRVTDAVYDAGFGAPSRFYEASEGRLGMTPSAWRDGGRGVSIHWTVVATSLGPMLVAATEKGICRLSFGENGTDLAARFPRAELIEGGEDFAALFAEVVAAVEKPGDSRHIPLDVQGTAFQEAVWRELRRIPPGKTRSYAEIAAAVGKPGAVRAAGSANGANNVAVLIPCHRVIRSDGTLGGYAYGMTIKQELLERERMPSR